MKTGLSVVVVAIMLGTGMAATADLGDWYYGESWAFMEAIGGISVDTPTRDLRGSVILPVHCNVSGLQAITQEPTQVNSALVVQSIETRVVETTIYLSVHTGLVSKGGTCRCTAVDLGDIPAGSYVVVYHGSDREKHALGSVDVPSK